MNIPFQVIEAPQHVYLMAYPSSYKIAIESTSPTNGYMVFKESYIKRFVSYLYYKKLVGEEEYKNKNAEVLFERYYFYKKGLTLLDLAGIQYCNYSVYYYEDEEQKSALEEIKKSYYLWPCEKNKHLLEWLLISVCGKAEYNQERDVAHLEMLCRINNGVGENVSNDRIKYEFSRLMKTQLTNNSDYAGFDKSYGLIYAAINDSILKSEISFAYHYELARLGYLNFKNKNYETDHLNKAYAINPKHADLRTIIKAYLGRLIEKTQDPANISKYLDEFTGAYSFLNDDSDFNNLRADCLLEQAYQYLAINQIAKGEKFLEEFENLCRQKPETKPTDRFVEKAYATAAAYYYKKGNVTKTKETLKRGMTYAPENFGLQMRLSQAH